MVRRRAWTKAGLAAIACGLLAGCNGDDYYAYSYPQIQNAQMQLTSDGGAPRFNGSFEIVLDASYTGAESDVWLYSLDLRDSNGQSMAASFAVEPQSAFPMHVTSSTGATQQVTFTADGILSFDQLTSELCFGTLLTGQFYDSNAGVYGDDLEEAYAESLAIDGCSDP